MTIQKLIGDHLKSSPLYLGKVCSCAEEYLCIIIKKRKPLQSIRNLFSTSLGTIHWKINMGGNRKKNTRLCEGQQAYKKKPTV